MEITESQLLENKAHIVVIDDEQVYREILCKSFTRLGFSCSHFSHPSESIETIKTQPAPIILLDLKLQEDSGLRWIKQLRAASKAAVIILLTGYASISTAVEAIKLGANDYLAKPITAREIIEYIYGKPKGSETPIAEKPMSVERLEWEHIQKVLANNDGNISAAARDLGMHRRTLQRKLAKKPARY